MTPHQIIVDNRLRLTEPEEGFASEVRAEIVELFEHDNPQWHKLRSLGLPTWKEKRVVKTWRKEGHDGLSFPRGGLKRLAELLEARGYEVKLADQRSRGEERTALDHKVALRLYQREALVAMFAKQNCLLRMATGGGKTTLGLAFAAMAKVPVLVICENSKLADQWRKCCVKELGLKPSEIGMIGGGKCVLGRAVTIAMPKSLVKRWSPELDAYFGCVIVDEVHGAAANGLQKTVDQISAKYRIGLSDDERRKDGKEFLVYDLFGDAAAKVTRDELVRGGHILDVEIRVVPTAFEAPWYGFDDAKVNHEAFGEEGAPVEEKEIDFVRLVEEMSRDQARNHLIYEMAIKEFERGEKTLVLAHRVDHTRVLDAGMAANRLPSGTLIGGKAFEIAFDQTLKRLGEPGAMVAVGTYKAVGQGINLPTVGVGIAATPIGGNEKFFRQVRGRFCRAPEGKHRAVLYYLWDHMVYPKHLKNLIKWNPTVRVLVDNTWMEGKAAAKRFGVGRAA